MSKDNKKEESAIIRPDQFTEQEYRVARAKLVKDASQRGRPRVYAENDDRLPEELNQFMGMEPSVARAMMELFPAPNPDLVASRRLRKVSSWGGKGTKKLKSVGVVIPQDILFLTGMRLGDLVLVSGWHQGIIRMVRIPEGE